MYHQLLDSIKKVFIPIDTSGNDMAIRIASGILNGVKYDYLSAAYPNSTTETYTYKTGGSTGTTVATLTIVYTDSSKESLSSVTRT